MSTMPAFCTAFGSATAWALPMRISYGPAVPNDLPPNAGRRLLTSSRVTRERAFGADEEAVWLRPLTPAAALNVTPTTTVVTHFASVIGPPIKRWIAAEFTPSGGMPDRLALKC